MAEAAEGGMRAVVIQVIKEDDIGKYFRKSPVFVGHDLLNVRPPEEIQMPNHIRILTIIFFFISLLVSFFFDIIILFLIGFISIFAVPALYQWRNRRLRDDKFPWPFDDPIPIKKPHSVVVSDVVDVNIVGEGYKVE